MVPSSPAGGPGFLGILEASFSHSYCPKEQSHPQPSFVAPKPRAALLESYTGEGQSHLEMGLQQSQLACGLESTYAGALPPFPAPSLSLSHIPQLS